MSSTIIDSMNTYQGIPSTVLESAVTAIQEARHGDSCACTLHRLEALAELQNMLTRTIRDNVEIARSFDHSWAEIGTALGFTRQAAQQRFGLSE